MGAVHTAAGRGRHSRHRRHRRVGVEGMEVEVEVEVGFRMLCVLMSHATDFKKAKKNGSEKMNGYMEVKIME